mmetsp:Transcript_29755/g.64840  ORF Transcript_29755/g.64840 Transcript_29755/m.64840 type:complete len:85 (+) Transcript_29755:622-876(+)
MAKDARTPASAHLANDGAQGVLDLELGAARDAPAEPDPDEPRPPARWMPISASSNAMGAPRPLAELEKPVQRADGPVTYALSGS